MQDLALVHVEFHQVTAKGSGAEAYAKGPFLKWQNCSGEAAKAPGKKDKLFWRYSEGRLVYFLSWRKPDIEMGKEEPRSTFEAKQQKCFVFFSFFQRVSKKE